MTADRVTGHSITAQLRLSNCPKALAIGYHLSTHIEERRITANAIHVVRFYGMPGFAKRGGACVPAGSNAPKAILQDWDGPRKHPIWVGWVGARPRQHVGVLCTAE